MTCCATVVPLFELPHTMVLWVVVPRWFLVLQCHARGGYELYFEMPHKVVPCHTVFFCLVVPRWFYVVKCTHSCSVTGGRGGEPMLCRGTCGALRDRRATARSLLTRVLTAL